MKTAGRGGDQLIDSLFVRLVEKRVNEYNFSREKQTG